MGAEEKAAAEKKAADEAAAQQKQKQAQLEMEKLLEQATKNTNSEDLTKENAQMVVTVSSSIRDVTIPVDVSKVAYEKDLSATLNTPESRKAMATLLGATDATCTVTLSAQQKSGNGLVRRLSATKYELTQDWAATFALPASTEDRSKILKEV